MHVSFFFESGLLVLRYMISGRRTGGFVFLCTSFRDRNARAIDLNVSQKNDSLRVRSYIVPEEAKVRAEFDKAITTRFPLPNNPNTTNPLRLELCFGMGCKSPDQFR